MTSTTSAPVAATPDITATVIQPDQALLLKAWQALRAPGQPVDPSAFEGHRWSAMAGHWLLLRREGSTDLRVRRQGLVHLAQTEQELAGKLLSSWQGAEALLTASLEVLDSRRPRCRIEWAQPGQAVLSWRELLLPLRDAQGREWLLIDRRVHEWRHQHVDHVLQASPVAMLGLRALLDERQVVRDWRITLANPALGRLLDIDVSTLPGRTVASALPQWAKLDLAAECVATLHGGSTRELQRLLGDDRAALRPLAIHVSPLSDGVVLSLSDPTLARAPTTGVQRLGGTDATTGLSDRQGFDERLRAEALCARRAGDNLSLVLAEIDHFPAYMQAKGSRASETAVRRIARLLAGACERENDLVARIGIQSYAMLLPSTDLRGASEVLARLRRALQRAAATAGDEAGGLTLSLGLAGFRRNFDEIDLVDRAEQALIEARLSGGDQLVVDVSSHPGASLDAEGQEEAGESTSLSGMETHHMEWTDSTMSDLGTLGTEVMSRFDMSDLMDAHPATIPDGLHELRHPDRNEPSPGALKGQIAGPLTGQRRDLPLDLSMDLPRNSGWAGLQAPRSRPRHH
ncbi:diguanylate cyclase domain-containing protein [Sphaerotilus mobilis]|uniref:diguanylate cyclase n=1 Tax=Sphaerotilus mobilis TaxID=47994 RepID=A0A4Q7LS91_9BURK|nr:diguanylate cyclase [Sphaerotilus mobilis]RZS57192.1 diguanylate cyclase (GGDEF)-like protein [Sphaerotilus mobilis]